MAHVRISSRGLLYVKNHYTSPKPGVELSRCAAGSVDFFKRGVGFVFVRSIQRVHTKTEDVPMAHSNPKHKTPDLRCDPRYKKLQRHLNLQGMTPVTIQSCSRAVREAIAFLAIVWTHFHGTI